MQIPKFQKFESPVKGLITCYIQELTIIPQSKCVPYDSKKDCSIMLVDLRVLILPLELQTILIKYMVPFVFVQPLLSFSKVNIYVFKHTTMCNFSKMLPAFLFL